jgi:hypothetical protein
VASNHNDLDHAQSIAQFAGKTDVSGVFPLNESNWF